MKRSIRIFTARIALAGLMLTATAGPCLAQSGRDEAILPDLSVYTLSDGGAVLRGNSIVADGDVHETDAGSVRNWVVLSKDEEAGVEATGIFFFGEAGKCVGFLPLESEYECQEIFFRPNGAYFVLVTGSGLRPDMFFNVYRFAGMEKTAELAGVRGSFAWVDDVRFLFTRIDDIREGVFPVLGYGLRVSAVMYDTAISEETVLKKATDKQNFRIGEISADGTTVTVTEESVKSEKDWNNEDKIKKRKIIVEIPAAG